MCSSGCRSTTNIEHSSNSEVQFWVDEETGVQYVIYSYYGYNGGMGGITPRLNADGTLYIEMEFEKRNGK